MFTFVATGGAYLLSQLHCSTVRRLHTFFQTSHTDFQSQWRIGSIQELGLISDLEKKGEEKRKQFSLLQGINEFKHLHCSQPLEIEAEKKRPFSVCPPLGYRRLAFNR